MDTSFNSLLNKNINFFSVGPEVEVVGDILVPDPEVPTDVHPEGKICASFLKMMFISVAEEILPHIKP